MTQEYEIEAALAVSGDTPRDVVVDILEAAEKARLIDAKSPIPTGVYFRYGNFYDQTSCIGMGEPFYQEWKHRAWEFPGNSHKISS